MSVDVETGPSIRAGWLTMRIAAALITGGGQLANADAFALAEQQTAGRRRSPGQRLNEAMRPLEADDVVVLVDGVWYAPNVADLGAWLADALEEHERRGLLSNPTIPRARVAA